MKRLTSLTIVLTVFLALVLLAGCSPSSSSRDGLVVGQSFRLESGETLNQDLTVAGGSAVLEEGSTLNGDIAVMGGSLSINGVVNGDISAMGGVVTLGSKAVIHGDVTTVGANLSRASGAVIDGECFGRSWEFHPPRCCHTGCGRGPLGSQLLLAHLPGLRGCRSGGAGIAVCSTPHGARR